MSELEKYISIRDKFSKELEQLSINMEKTCWDFYINSNHENMDKYEEAQDNYSEFFQNSEDIYSALLKIDGSKLPSHEAKQLKDLLKEFDEELNSGEELKALRLKENEIAQKYNSYVMTIDGKEVSKAEITKIIQTETNPDIRQKAYETKLKGGDLIADDLVDFVKMRNEYAKKKGYENYFNYKLKEDYDVEIDFLDKLIDDVYTKSKDKIKQLQDKRRKELKEFFGVDSLEGFHYGLLLDSNPEKGVNKILECTNPTCPHDEKGVNEVLECINPVCPHDEKGVNEVLECINPTCPHDEKGVNEVLECINPNIIENLAKKTYSGMGYDIDKMIDEGRLTLDLYPRKGKNTHGFCFGVEAGKDSRILANLTNNVISIDTLNHELGHCVYDLGLSRDLPFLDRRPTSSAVTEAIAMMMGDIMKMENILSDIVPEELLLKFKNTHSEDEAAFVSRSLEIIDFERQLYQNPNQNIAELWNRIRAKYLNRFEGVDNEWATIPHYLSHPGYYQNYFRATLMKAQIYAHLRSIFGNITENKETSAYLDKNIFAKGASIDEYELIKELTGKEFSVDDFVAGL